MVVGAFPVVKLAVLAFKQLSKPVANVIKERAKHSPFFRKYVCMPPAQIYNWGEVKIKMWTLNLGKTANIPKLNETMAIELGANLLGEFVIYSIGAGLLIFEYVRQVNKEAAREAVIQDEKKLLQLTLQNLALEIERQDAKIRHLSRTVAEIESRKWLPRLKILSKDPEETGAESDKEIQKVELSKPTEKGNNENDGLITKSLILIERDIFCSDCEPDDGRHIIQKALKYLKYDY